MLDLVCYWNCWEVHVYTTWRYVQPELIAHVNRVFWLVLRLQIKEIEQDPILRRLKNNDWRHVTYGSPFRLSLWPRDEVAHPVWVSFWTWFVIRIVEKNMNTRCVISNQGHSCSILEAAVSFAVDHFWFSLSFTIFPFSVGLWKSAVKVPSGLYNPTSTNVNDTFVLIHK